MFLKIDAKRCIKASATSFYTFKSQILLPHFFAESLAKKGYSKSQRQIGCPPVHLNSTLVWQQGALKHGFSGSHNI